MSWGSALGVFISHLPTRNPLGESKILSKDPKTVAWAESFQVPSESKILMIEFFIFMFLAAWGRERL